MKKKYMVLADINAHIPGQAMLKGTVVELTDEEFVKLDVASALSPISEPSLIHKEPETSKKKGG